MINPAAAVLPDSAGAPSIFDAPTAELGSDRKVFVGNLPFGTTEDEIKSLFKEYGTVVGTSVRKDRETGNDKGFGFVTFEDASSAEAAIAGMNGQFYQVSRGYQ
jgi:RNA recognition motif-containing protein